MERRIFLKELNDIDVKLMLCKSNFQWKLLAEKYSQAEEKIKNFYGEDIPEEVSANLQAVREKLVEKKAELPEEDLVI